MKITEHDLLITLASMAIKMDDLTPRDVIKTIKELGHEPILREARAIDRKQCVSGDEARVATKQHRSPCGDCPWRRKSLPGWLGSASTEQWLAEAHGEARIDCHTLTGVQCAGAAIYRSNVMKLPRDRKLLKIAANRVLVFSGPGEFRKHHAVKV